MIAVFASEVTTVRDVNFCEIFCFEHNSLQIKPKEVQNCLRLLFHDRITRVATFKALSILWKSLEITKEQVVSYNQLAYYLSITSQGLSWQMNRLMEKEIVQKN